MNQYKFILIIVVKFNTLTNLYILTKETKTLVNVNLNLIIYSHQNRLLYHHVMTAGYMRKRSELLRVRNHSRTEFCTLPCNGICVYEKEVRVTNKLFYIKISGHTNNS